MPESVVKLTLDRSPYLIGWSLDGMGELWTVEVSDGAQGVVSTL